MIRYTEDQVKAAAFYNGVAGQAKQKGYTAREWFTLKFGDLPGEEKIVWGRVGKKNSVDLFLCGEDVDKTAILIISKPLNDMADDPELKKWIMLFEAQADSEIVKMELETSYEVAPNGMQRITKKRVYLAALVHKEQE